MLRGSSNAARTKGSAPCPACAIASRTNAASDTASTSPCWYAASRPNECANPPAGNAESTNCQMSQLIVASPLATKARRSRRRTKQSGTNNSSCTFVCFASSWLKQEVPLRERQHARRFRFQYLAVSRDDVGLRVDGDLWQGVVQLHVALAERTAAADGRQPLADAQPCRDAGVERGFRHERERDGFHRTAERAEHRTHQHGLWRRDGRVRIAHLRPCDESALDDQLRFDAEELRPPQDQIGELAGFHRTDLVRDAMCNRRVDRVLRDVAANAQVVVVALFA